MLHRYDNIIIQVTCRAMVPFIQLFALYVIFHGHHGPGGGFQGGVLLGVSIILLRLFLGKESSSQIFSPKLAVALAASGMLAFMITGLIPLAMGGAFLDYAYLPLPGVSGVLFIIALFRMRRRSGD